MLPVVDGVGASGFGASGFGSVGLGCGTGTGIPAPGLPNLSVGDFFILPPGPGFGGDGLLGGSGGAGGLGGLIGGLPPITVGSFSCLGKVGHNLEVTLWSVLFGLVFSFFQRFVFLLP